MESPFVDKLKQIIASRYGKGFKVRQLLDISQSPLSEYPLMAGGDLHIPISMNGLLLGSGIIPAANDMTEESKQSVSELVKMVMEPSLYKWYLERKENNLVAISQKNLNLENVEPFHNDTLSTLDFSQTQIDRRENKADDHSEEVYADADEKFQDDALISEKLMTHFVHLEGDNMPQIKKVALTINEMTSRWAFVPFNDIKSQLHSAGDISKMGAMSLFIEDIEALNEFEQEILIDYLAVERDFEEPIIISASNKPIQDLVHENKVAESLMDEVVINSIDIRRAPMGDMGLREMLELLLIKNDFLIS